MITIPAWLLLVALVVACLAGVATPSLRAANEAKRWQKVRDDLREQRDDFRDRLSESTKRLRECEAVLATIREVLPPETSVTITRS